MSRKYILTGVAAFVIVFGCCLIRARQPVSMVLRGFVTHDLFPDYSCAIIDVTNTSSRPVICWNMNWVRGWIGRSGPNAYYTLRDGFQSHILGPHSGFSFESLVCRDSTNKLALQLVQLRPDFWPLGHLPRSMEQKVPEFFRRSPKQFTISIEAIHHTMQPKEFLGPSAVLELCSMHGTNVDK